MAEQQTPAAAPTLFPFLRYDDARAAIAWLVEVFGFKQDLVVDGPQGTVAHAQLSFGNGVIMLGTAKDDALRMRSPRRLPAVNQGIYAYVADVDAHYARAKTGGAEIVIEIQDKDYGSREYAARDLEGNLWSFGTYRPASGT